MRGWLSVGTWAFALPFLATSIVSAQSTAPSPTVVDAARAPQPTIASYAFVERDLVARAADGSVLRSIPLSSRAAAIAPTPLVVNGTLVACTGAWVYSLDPLSLIVRARAPLPGRCRSLSPSGSRVHVLVATSHDDSSPSQRVTVDPNTLELPFTLADIGGLVAQRARATVLDLPGSPTPGARLRAMREPLRRAAVETALAEVERRAMLDATNPWFDVERGHLLGALGRFDDAHRAYESALGHDPRYDADLIGVAAELDLSEPAFADAAFERGLRAWIRGGYEPELALGLIGTVAVFRAPEPDLRGEARFEYLARRANRLARFAPVVEGSAYFYEAMRREAHDLGDPREGRFAALRDRAVPTRMLGPLAFEARVAGDLLNAIPATGCAIVLVLTIQLARSRSRRAAPGTSSLRRLIPFTRLGWVGRVSAIVGAVALLALGTVAARGIAEIAMVAQSPIGFMSGVMGDAQTVAYTRSFGPSDEAQFVRGFAQQMAGDARGALSSYRRSSHPRAHLNRGVLLATHGDDAGARRAFQQALDADPALSEARFDLGHETRSTRLDRLVRAGVLAPFSAPPTRHDLALAIRDAVSHNQRHVLGNPVRATASIFSLTGSVTSASTSPSIPTFLLYAVLVLAALAVLAPSFGIEWEPTGEGRLGFYLGLLVPGGSRAYGPFGVLVLAVFLTMVFGTLTLASSNGQSANILEAIALPDFGRYFGASAPITSGEVATMRAFYGAWWMLGLAHVAFVLVTERAFPDPIRTKP